MRQASEHVADSIAIGVRRLRTRILYGSLIFDIYIYICIHKNLYIHKYIPYMVMDRPPASLGQPGPGPRVAGPAGPRPGPAAPTDAMSLAGYM
jgi:hypothetical protein